MVIGWDRDFPGGIEIPPAHPNCRCAVVLMPPDTAETPFTEGAQAEYEGPEPETFETRSYKDFPDADLDDVQSMAIDSYRGSESNLINRAYGNPTEVDPNTGQMRMFTSEHDKALVIKDSMSPLEENVMLARGVDPESLGINNLNIQSREKTYDWGTGYNRVITGVDPETLDGLVGRTYDFNWFLSTSAATDGGNLTPPQAFADRMPVWMELRVPAGTNAVKVPGSREREVILDRSRAIVTGARVDNGKLILDMLITENL
jgi:hypothetical protein